MSETLSIKKDKLRWIFYYIPQAVDMGAKEHPQKEMHKLGINLMFYIPMMIADGWHVLTDYQGELPEYIIEKTLEPHEEMWERMFDINLEE